jgi:hypothetical protein
VVDGDFGYNFGSPMIGEVHHEAEPGLIQGFIAPTANRDFTADEWGTVLSGFSPIRDHAGNVVGIVGVDMDSTIVMAVLNQANLVVFLIGIFAMIAVMVGILGIENRRAEYDRKIGESEKNSRILSSCYHRRFLKLMIRARLFRQTVLLLKPLVIQMKSLRKE